jgi:hypothetical protein
MYEVWRQIPDEYDCIVEVLDKMQKNVNKDKKTLKKGFI